MERKFLHDLAAPLSLIRIQTALILKELEKAANSESNEKLKTRLQKINKSIGKMEELHANHKSKISAAGKK